MRQYRRTGPRAGLNGRPPADARHRVHRAPRQGTGRRAHCRTWCGLGPGFDADRHVKLLDETIHVCHLVTPISTLDMVNAGLNGHGRRIYQPSCPMPSFLSRTVRTHPRVNLEHIRNKVHGVNVGVQLHTDRRDGPSLEPPET